MDWLSLAYEASVETVSPLRYMSESNLLQGTSEGQVTGLTLSLRDRWYLGCDPLLSLVDKHYTTSQRLLSIIFLENSSQCPKLMRTNGN